MSLENMSAENRNVYPAIPFRMARTMSIVSSHIRAFCCSFCGQPTHNVLLCNDSRLRDFEIMCVESCRDSASASVFKIWMRQHFTTPEEHHLILSFAVKKCRISMQSSISHCIERITQFIFTTYTDVQMNNLIENNIDLESMYLLQGEFRQRVITIETLIAERLRTQPNTLNKFNIESIVEAIVEVDNEDNDNCECAICLDAIIKINFVKLGCGHDFCKDCIIRTLQNETKEYVSCALCRSEVKTIKYQTPEILNEVTAFIL